MAIPIAELLPKQEELALTAGVQNPLVWGVRRGVGRRPSEGAKRPGVYPVGVGSMVTAALQGLGVERAEAEPH